MNFRTFFFHFIHDQHMVNYLRVQIICFKAGINNLKQSPSLQKKATCANITNYLHFASQNYVTGIKLCFFLSITTKTTVEQQRLNLHNKCYGLIGCLKISIYEFSIYRHSNCFFFSNKLSLCHFSTAHCFLRSSHRST